MRQDSDDEWSHGVVAQSRRGRRRDGRSKRGVAAIQQETTTVVVRAEEVRELSLGLGWKIQQL